MAEQRVILVVGDPMLDIYAYGSLATCQDNCLKFIETYRVQVDGGAANAARSIGDKCKVVCVPGMLSYKTRLIVGASIVFRHDVDAKGSADFSLIERHIARQPHGVLISDYDKGALSATQINWIINYCKLNGIYCVADVKRPSDVYYGAIRKGNADYIGEVEVRTRGAEVPLLGEAPIIAADAPVPLVNHVGAGDCFAAHLLLALTLGKSLYDACVFAHSAGRIYVQHKHNRPPSIREIRVDMGEEIG